MKQAINATKLHFINRTNVFWVPIFMMITAAVIAVLLQVLAGNLDYALEDTDVGATEIGKGNSTIVWMLAGFLIYLGIASVSMRFPFALSLGSTRRAFTLGTLVYHLIQAIYVSVLIMVLLWLELATNHWFSDMYIFDIYTLGNGHIGWAGLIGFLMTLGCMSVGGVFGATWLRFGSKGPIVIGVLVGLVVVLGLLILSPMLPAIAENFRLWWLTVAAVIVILLSVLGEYLALRGASIR